jgi:hypothetical protein
MYLGFMQWYDFEILRQGLVTKATTSSHAFANALVRRCYNEL